MTRLSAHGSSSRSGNGGLGVLPTLRSGRLRAAASVSVAALIFSGLVVGLVGGPAAAAAPGNPGVPSAGTQVYQEDFQNAPVTSATRVAAYTSASGAKYSAAAVYQNTALCNGLIFGHQASNATLGAQGFCGSSGPGWWPSSRTIPSGIGLYNGMTDPSQNLAVAEQTVGGCPNYVGTMLEGSGIALPTSGRFLTFSVQVGNLCSSGVQALDRFYLLDGPTAIPLNTADYNICADPNRQTFRVDAQTVTVGTFTGNQSALVNSSTIGFRLTNQQPSGSGNDQAFDNFKILDVTPQLDKAFSPAVIPTGGAATLTFTITNTSELAAKNGWSFTDALPSGLTVAPTPAVATTCPAGVVTAGAGSTSVVATGNLASGMTSCTVSVDVTSASTGVAYTNGPSNVTTVGLNPPGSSTVHFESPALTVMKHAGAPVDVNGDGTTDAGDTIAYDFTVTNTGDVPLTTIGVTDAKVGAVTCPLPTLAPGAAETCTPDDLYTVTGADVTAGAVNNTATAHGTPPSGASVTSAPSVTSTPAANPNPALTVVKSATPSGPTTFVPGQTVTYNFVVTNVGNVTMSGISVNDTAFTGSGTLSTPSCQQTTLAPQAQTICTVDYTLTSTDVNSGSVTNTATVQGTPPGSPTPVPSSPSSVTIPTPEAPAITLTKTASPTTITGAGQTVTYSFLITNTGNVSLSAIQVPETAFSGTGTLSAVACPDSTLIAGQFETCTASYPVTQTDVDTGIITNTAIASGAAPSGTRVAADPSTASVNIVRTPALSMVKTADVTAAAAGQTVTYSFLVTNSGNVTITDPTIDETAFSGTGTLSAIECPSGPITLAPGDDLTCTATYTVTQDDVDSGSLTNTAAVTGTPPVGTPIPVSPPSESIVTTSPAPALAIVKTADVRTITRAGQLVTYSFTITNAGNVTISNPVVHEGSFTGHGALAPVTCPAGTSTLAPAASVTCTTTYTVEASDLVRGGTLSNTATASGTVRGGSTITSDPSTATTEADPPGGLAFTGTDAMLSGTSIAVLLLLSGGLFIGFRRRRREDRTEEA